MSGAGGTFECGTMKVDSSEFVGYFPKMRELAKAGAILTVEDGEKVYEFRLVRNLSPEEQEARNKEWREQLAKGRGRLNLDNFEEDGPIISLEEWGSLA